jgi:hypothetical protein
MKLADRGAAADAVHTATTISVSAVTLEKISQTYSTIGRYLNLIVCGPGEMWTAR